MIDHRNREPARIVTGDDNRSDKSSEIDWDAVYDNQKYEDDKPEKAIDNPAVKIGFGCVLPLLALVAFVGAIGSGPVGTPGSATIWGQMAGYLIVLILFTWVPVLIFWLRDRSPFIIGGSLVFALALFSVVGMAGLGSVNRALMDDARALSEVKINEDGTAVLPDEFRNSGPMSALIFDVRKKADEIKIDYQAETEELGLDQMFDPRTALISAPIKSGCDSILAFKGQIDYYHIKHMTLLDKYIAGIDELNLPPAHRRDVKRGALQNFHTTKAGINLQWELEKKSMTPIYKSCKIIDRRRWKARGEMFVFTNGDDLAAFGRESEKFERISAKLFAVQTAAAHKLRADQAQLQKDFEPYDNR